MRILIGDDHKIIRDGLRAILEKQDGMVVVGEAANGHEALALLPKVHANLAIMDVTMPGLNAWGGSVGATRTPPAGRPSARLPPAGLDGVSVARAARRAHAVLPVVFISGEDGSRGALQGALQESSTALATKPVNVSKLVQTLDRLLAGAATHRRPAN